MNVNVNQSLRLTRLLQQLFVAQARDYLSRVTLDGPPPDMTHWSSIMEQACKPTLLNLHQQGMVRSAARIAAKLGQRTPVDARTGLRSFEPGNQSIFGTAAKRLEYPQVGSQGNLYPARGWAKTSKTPASLVLKNRRHLVCKAAGNVKLDFDLFNPRVLDAVAGATFTFCRETMATAVGDMDEALGQLRELLRLGLPRGDAIQLLAKKTREVFADPARAFRIATTETSRAMHGGQLFAAVESGVCAGKQWLASSDACERCLALDGKQVKLDEPFWVDPKGGFYAMVWYPPLHPH